jgi:aspartate aminotransferase
LKELKSLAALSKILDGFQPSLIGEIFSLATRLKEGGRDIIDLSIGEPDFDTPEHVCETAIEAIRKGATKYTGTDGTTALKRAVQAKLARDNGLDYGVDQIVIDSGVKPLLYHAMQAVLDPGDEVIVPTPCWPSYEGMVTLLGATTVLVPTAEQRGFKLDPEDLERAITPRTKLAIFNSPGNPTGAAYSAAELSALAEVLLRHPQVWVFSDDIYEHILFDGFRFATLAQVEPRMQDRALTFNGVSKGYAMTGWRVGYVAGPRGAIDALRVVVSHNNGNPPSMSQMAAVAALEGPQGFLAERAASFQERRDLAAGLINAIPGLRCALPEGAFYLYVNCGGTIGSRTPDGGRIETSSDLVRYFLTEAGVAVVPGAAFSHDPYFRLSYASPRAELEAAGRRLAKACSRLETA